MGVHFSGSIICEASQLQPVLVLTASATNSPGGDNSATASVACPSGYLRTGGGGSAGLASGTVGSPHLEDSRPDGFGGWVAKAVDGPLGNNVAVTAYVICLNVNVL